MFYDRTVDLLGVLGDTLVSLYGGGRPCPKASPEISCHVRSVMDEAMRLSFLENPYFHPYMQKNAILALAGSYMDSDVLRKWLSSYDLTEMPEKTALVVAAGNIPAVAFHDYAACLLLGLRTDFKLSSKDRHLIPAIDDCLRHIGGGAMTGIRFSTDLPCSRYDKVIVTGSDSTVSFFNGRYEGSDILARKSRYSLAVLSGNESAADLDSLARDAAMYYGLGCRSVSYLLVPEGYDFAGLSSAFSRFRDDMEKTDPSLLVPFDGAYRRLKALKIMGGEEFVDLGFMILERDRSEGREYPSFGCLRYSDYPCSREGRAGFIRNFIIENKDRIQKKYTNFGIAQSPSADDYADGLDTVEFLSDKKRML